MIDATTIPYTAGKFCTKVAGEIQKWSAVDITCSVLMGRHFNPEALGVLLLNCQTGEGRRDNIVSLCVDIEIGSEIKAKV